MIDHILFSCKCRFYYIKSLGVRKALIDPSTTGGDRESSPTVDGEGMEDEVVRTGG